MRRGFAAALVTLALLLAGCAPGPEQPAPSPTEATDPPADLPAADDAVTALVAALNARDVSTLPMVRNPADAQAEFETVFAGMDEIYPTVERTAITYEDPDGALATLTMTYQLGKDGWTYDSTARLRHIEGVWRVDWSPQLLHPQLTSDSRLRHTTEEARRGPINDNTGLALVEQRSLYEVGIDKGAVIEADQATAAADLATLLQVDVAAFQKKVAANGPKAFVIAATLRQEDIPSTVVDIPGSHVREITAVVGPTDSFAAPLLGTVGHPTQEMIDKSDGALTPADIVGLSGLQSRYDEQLRGVPSVRVDVVGRKAAAGASAAPFDAFPVFQQDASIGTGIQLSLDRDLQAKAEEVLSTQTGLATLVVVDVATGGILAAAQSPSGGTFPYATYGKYAPGSTFKAVTALAMLRGGVTPTSTVKCPSSLKVGSHTFGNYSGYPSSALGSVTLTDAFKYSCNTAFAGSSVSGDQLHAAAGSLGVGTDYDAGFTSYFGTVQPGNAIDLAASKIGQGQVTMSPLGMAAVAASIGSGKTTIPWLVKDKQAASTAAPLTAAEATALQSMMTATVDSGTGKSLKGIMTGAKTGPAEWGKAGAQQTHAWMIAYNSTYAVSAFVEVGDSGGTTAAPLIVSLFS